MGSFVYLKDKNSIPKKRWEQFTDEFYRLAVASGMMTCSEIQMFDMNIYLLKPPEVNDERIWFNYNYFENEFWENAGLEKADRSVYSGKVGSFHFNRTMVALYLLELVYTDWKQVVKGDVNNPEQSIIRWIDYVLNTNYRLLPRFNDYIYVYEEVFGKNIDSYKKIKDYVAYKYGSKSSKQKEFIAYIFQEKGIEKGMDFFYKDMEENESILDYGGYFVYLEFVRNLLDKYDSLSAGIKIDANYMLACMETWRRRIIQLKNQRENNSVEPEYASNIIILCGLGRSFAGKIMSEVFLLSDEEIDVVLKTYEEVKSLNNKDDSEAEGIAATITTACMEANGIEDRLAYWWTIDGPITLSEEYYEEMGKVRGQYQLLLEEMAEDITLRERIQRLINICYNLSTKLKGVMLFEDLFYELLTNITDNKYFGFVELLEHYFEACRAEMPEKDKISWSMWMSLEAWNIIWKMKVLIATLANSQLRHKIFQV